MSTAYYFANDVTDRYIINNSHFRAWYTKEGRRRDGQRDPDPDVRSACACDA